jgi:serine O-acetyltransferase
MLKDVAIVGWEEGSAGLVDSWAGAAGLNVVCFVHPADRPPDVTRAAAMSDRDASQFAIPEQGQFKGRQLICAADWPQALHRAGIGAALVTHSDNHQRLREIERAQAAGIELASAIHPSALVLADALLAANVILHARSLVGYRAEIGLGTVLNSGAQVDHHCVLREACSLDPGVTLAGNVTVARFARLHTGAVVKNRIRIGLDATVGAGAVVIKDVAEGTTVVGNPARPIDQRPSSR